MEDFSKRETETQGVLYIKFFGLTNTFAINYKQRNN